MLNNETPVKIAKILSGESVDVDFNLSVGDGTTNSATPGDTAMDNELGRRECTLQSNNVTGIISTQINAIDAEFAGESMSELGVFDKSTAGQIFDRATDFTAVTMASDTIYYNDNFYEVSNANNTDLNKITDNGIAQLFAVLEGDTIASHS